MFDEKRKKIYIFSEILMAKLETPVTFAHLLETWVRITCMLCGRGENDTTAYYNSTCWKSFEDPYSETKTQRYNDELSEQRRHKEALLQAWDGAFCPNCGRGKKVMNHTTDMEIEQACTKIKSIQQRERILMPKEFMSPHEIYETLYEWITTPCRACERGCKKEQKVQEEEEEEENMDEKQKQPIKSTNSLTLLKKNKYQQMCRPLPLQLLIEVWANKRCVVCGLGGYCNGLSFHMDQQESHRRAVVYAKEKKKKHPKEDLLLGFLKPTSTSYGVLSSFNNNVKQHDEVSIQQQQRERKATEKFLQQQLQQKQQQISSSTLKRKSIGNLLEAYIQKGSAKVVKK